MFALAHRINNHKADPRDATLQYVVRCELEFRGYAIYVSSY